MTKMRIGIVGAGTMGTGIAQLAAMSGDDVVLTDLHPTCLTKARERHNYYLKRLVQKNKITETEALDTLNRIKYSQSVKDFQTSDLVIEAIVEDLTKKRNLFRDLEQIVGSDCILASNTSSLSIASIASACSIPERVIGIHFFNPAAIMKLVEIIPAVQSSENTFDLSRKWVEGIGKIWVRAKDTPGFIVNKVARPYYSEALRIFEEGFAEPKQIDEVMVKCGKFKMGPFELMDFIGIDVNFAVTQEVYKSFFFDPRYRPSLIQQRMVEAGWLGVKTSKGFYDYNIKKNDTDVDLDPAFAQAILDRILIMLINEAADTVFRKIADVQDVDDAMRSGVNYPKGLLKWADEIGIPECIERIDALYEEYKEDRYRCCPLMRRMAKNNLKFYPE